MKANWRTQWEESPIPEPYPYLKTAGRGEAEERPSPDPLFAQRWESPSADDDLEIFVRKPVAVDCDTKNSFGGLETFLAESAGVKVFGPGRIRLDFGTELAGWLEVDIPDLSGEVILAVSEYNQPAIVNNGPESSAKAAAPRKYGTTYRLELNSELYEGVRSGFIDVVSFRQPFTITGVRLVCQAKPVNYRGSFDCDDSMLNRIWYTSAYVVRVNLKKDYFAAILVDRGDRHSWTGDAHVSQAVALAAFANYDFVLKNLHYTEGRPNGVESYELYWVLSLVDYYRYTGDAHGVRGLLPKALARLDHACEIYGTNPPLCFWGWDERLGAGFENPDLTENQHSYKLLSIHAWKSFACVLEHMGEEELARRYQRCAAEKTEQLLAVSGFFRDYGMHASAEAINADLPVNIKMLYHKDLEDRLNRLSYSPFNQYFILQAMARAGRHDDAILTILDLWGGQIEYGGTTFFETFRPGWSHIIEKNGPPPNNQSGYTSLAHPWSGGALVWLSEEVLGVKPEEPGFVTFTVLPHLGRRLRRVRGEVPTPLGIIRASFNLETGVHEVTVPQGATATVGIPKAERAIGRISCNGKDLEDGREDREFRYIQGLSAGTYRFTVDYAGETPPGITEEYRYPAAFLGRDDRTRGDWRAAYGSEGYAFCGVGIQSLPGYVKELRFGKEQHLRWKPGPDDMRALTGDGGEQRILGCVHTEDDRACYQTFTADIILEHEREFTVALYFVDWDEKGRELAVEMFDGETRNLVAPLQALHGYGGGVYLVYRYHRSARFRINHIRGLNATLSGIFFGMR